MDSQTRRDFVRRMAWASATSAVAALVPGTTMAAWKASDSVSEDITWHKAPCRFCGTGCGVLIGTAGGHAVAVKGDPQSEVSRGLLCVKGYHSIQSLYGKDRLRKAFVKRDGKMVEVSVSEALDVIADKMKAVIKADGKDAVAMYGSGQWTIPDGYVASKLFKGCIGTNNVEANARLCMASAVTGFLTTFGADEPMGCYEDMDYADTFILWGNNMAEMHPVLYSRLLTRRRTGTNVKIIDLTTRHTRTSESSDKTIIFAPQSDLAIANGICRILLEKGWIDNDFIKKHVAFKTGKTNIGYGLEDTFKFKDEASASTIAEFKKLVAEYTPEKVQEISGVSPSDLAYLAQEYGNPARKVMSFWCMGMNQHTRGTWINNLVYNIHLLTGKISTPGNSPFSLTGQPSACGTVREVGTLTHKLPHGVVMDEGARKMAAEIWNVPVENIDPKPSNHTMQMFRALDRGEIKFVWIQVTNPMVTLPKLARYRDGLKKDGRFVVVSEIYPTPTTDVADVILPSAMWIEREGMYGNSERRTQHFNKLVDPPGECMSDTWQLIEVARRLGFEKQFPWAEEEHIEKIWNEYGRFHAGAKHGMAPYEVLKERPGVIWPFVNGKSTQWRFNRKFDPACEAGEGEFDFYGKPDRKAWIWFRPYEPPPEMPDAEYPFWLNTGRVIEHWHTGSMTRRIPTLHKAMPNAYVEVNRQDAAAMGIRNGEKVRLVSRRGSLEIVAWIDGRGKPTPGQVFVPFFDENLLINDLTLDAYCPISNQPDYKKCAVRMEKIS